MARVADTRGGPSHYRDHGLQRSGSGRSTSTLAFAVAATYRSSKLVGAGDCQWRVGGRQQTHADAASSISRRRPVECLLLQPAKSRIRPSAEVAPTMSDAEKLTVPVTRRSRGDYARRPSGA